MIAEVHFVQKFLTKGVLKSGRAHYLEMIGAACSFILDTELDYQK